jgi:hypothetical protein
MKYTLRIESEKIIAVNRWKPKYFTIYNNKNLPIGTKTYYDIPEGLEEITENQYNELVNRNDLSFINWRNGKVVKEPKKQKENRLASYEEAAENRRIDKIVNEVEYLSKYFELNNEGKKLLEDGRNDNSGV